MNKIIIYLSIVVSLLAVDAKIEIVKKVDVKPKIYIKNITVGKYISISKKIYNLVTNDLKVSGHFNVGNNIKHNEIFEATALKALGYNLMLKINLVEVVQGSIKVTMLLEDLNLNKVVKQKEYTVSKIKKYPFIAHSIAIDTNGYIQAPSIDWMNRFVVFSKYKGAKRSLIVVADYTLTYQQIIIKGGLNLFPKWADKNQENIYYSSLSSKIPTLFKVNIFTGEKEAIYQSHGMIVCSDVSKDGNKLLLTIAPKDQPDIYVLNLKDKTLKEITKYRGIDVNGHFSDNDSRVIFVSNRLKTPNIFAKSINGGGVERLVDFGKNNSSCVTHNQDIVYSSKEYNSEFESKTFNLYLISTISSELRKLTATGINQFPLFSEDGETIMYLKKYKNQSSLGIIRLKNNKSYLYPLNIDKIQSIDW